MFCHTTTTMTFQPDAHGRSYSDSDSEQLTLVGVDRIYQAVITTPHRSDTARLMFGECYIPADRVRRTGIAYVSQQALERALWEYLNDHRLFGERAALLSRLRFDIKQPYEVLYDVERSLYAFRSVIAPPPITAPVTRYAS